MSARSLAAALGAFLALSVVPTPASGEELVENGSFEGGAVIPNSAALNIDLPEWVETSTLTESPIWSIEPGDFEVGGPRFGQQWAWLGCCYQANEVSVAQSVEFPAGGAATLRFYLWVGFAGGNGDEVFRVTLDNERVFEANHTLPSPGVYMPFTVDLTEFADGAAHELVISYENPTTDLPGIVGGFFLSLDDVSIEHTPADPAQEEPPADAPLQPNCRGEAATIAGTDEPETLVGTAGADVIAALGGTDTVRSLGGDDIVCGGAGPDSLSTGGGADRLLGRSGNDRLRAGAGDDHLDGGSGVDSLDGGTGADDCLGWSGPDSLARCSR